MKKIILLLPLLLTIACTNQKFQIDGTIADADSQTLYLVRTTLNGAQQLDSAKLKENGHFSFRQQRPEYPDIYFLQLGKQRFYFAIDSTEHIHINATANNLALTKDITGSDNTLKIAELRESLLTQDTEQHKQLQRQTILQNPRSIVAYFALHQTKDSRYILQMNEKDDLPCYRAVATAFNTFMPNYYRSKFLYQQVLAYINNEKATLNNAFFMQMIQESENAFLDITLPDENGTMQSLSQHKGKVIVLDFSAVGMENSTAYFFDLKEIYNKYHNRGLDIYQVSADRQRLLWEDNARNLPWTTVFLGDNSSCIIDYNVQAIPTVFLFNRKGEIVGRYFSFKDLKDDIEKLL